ncbi:ABC transporter permease [Catenuloplanes atrovinosus]|uniref:Simple sugar transport system permease protein n=1 Tax=Catenuloplanes atrovinosus TaxID=137266 RepID=A0AAE3YYV5_9ACTN|nr:ABC transporter permease [Catenuloplanes atrovinosus]MDR7280689.1 simple sugar transport system permease protein [Catenuloplanes atrovinosus]
MSTTLLTVDDLAPAKFWTRQRRSGAVLAGVGLVAAVVFALLAESAPARFTLSEDAEGAALSIDGKVGAALFGVITVVAGGALLAGVARRWFNVLLAAGVLGFVLSFLCWQVAGSFMPLVGTASGSLDLAVPLILGALCGVLCERTGVVNIGIEGQLLMGAFGAALVGTMTASVWLGVVGAIAGSVLIAALLAVLAIRFLVDQVVIGTVLNLLALGVTGFLYERLMQTDAASFNTPPHMENLRIPVLADIPLVGPVLFDTSPLVYLALILVAVIHFGLGRTRWGLRTRAVGEHPTAADTVGIRVRGTRYLNVLLGGVVAGLGGAFFTLVSTGAFGKNMTAGAGFIALAALIFGGFRPVGALFAALFFGFANTLAIYLSAIGSPVPSQFLNMLPYIATIVAVAGLVGRVRAPAADGKPYVTS